jgi:hypothetical protein
MEARHRSAFDQAVLGDAELEVERLVHRVRRKPSFAAIDIAGCGILQCASHCSALGRREHARDLLQCRLVLLVRVPALELQLIEHPLCVDVRRVCIVHDESAHRRRHPLRQLDILGGERRPQLILRADRGRREEAVGHMYDPILKPS